MKRVLAFIVGLFFVTAAYADNVLVIDPQYAGVAGNVKIGRAHV